MAVNSGNLMPFLEAGSPLSAILDRKARPLAVDVVLSLPKRDSHAYYASVTLKSFVSVGKSRNRVLARGKSNSEVNGVDFDAEPGDEERNGKGYGDVDDQSYDWEKEMRRRLREFEERRELEKKAEELQSKAEDAEGEGKEETEEEKRTRVRKELEKVCFC